MAVELCVLPRLATKPLLNCLCAVLRLDSEQCGNADAYRVTRDVPLPYALPNEHAKDEGSGSDREEEPEKIATRLKALWSRQSDASREAHEPHVSKLERTKKVLGEVDDTEHLVESNLRKTWERFKDEISGKYREMDSSDEGSAPEESGAAAKKKKKAQEQEAGRLRVPAERTEEV